MTPCSRCGEFSEKFDGDGLCADCQKRAPGMIMRGRIIRWIVLLFLGFPPYILLATVTLNKFRGARNHDSFLPWILIIWFGIFWIAGRIWLRCRFCATAAYSFSGANSVLRGEGRCLGCDKRI
jgi:hypothetical protein